MMNESQRLQPVDHKKTGETSSQGEARSNATSGVRRRSPVSGTLVSGYTPQQGEFPPSGRPYYQTSQERDIHLLAEEEKKSKERVNLNELIEDIKFLLVGLDHLSQMSQDGKEQFKSFVRKLSDKLAQEIVGENPSMRIAGPHVQLKRLLRLLTTGDITTQAAISDIEEIKGHLQHWVAEVQLTIVPSSQQINSDDATMRFRRPHREDTAAE